MQRDTYAAEWDYLRLERLGLLIGDAKIVPEWADKASRECANAQMDKLEAREEK